MSFNFYTNMISLAGKRAAAGALILGLALIGFGAVILAMPEVFVFLAAAVFFIAGAACTALAVKIYLAQRKLFRAGRSDSDAYRQNVRIHIEEHCDL